MSDRRIPYKLVLLSGAALFVISQLSVSPDAHILLLFAWLGGVYLSLARGVQLQ